MRRSIVALLSFLILSTDSFADNPESIRCQVITPEMCPVLIYVDSNEINIVSFKDHDLRTIKVLLPTTATLTRLDCLLFLANLRHDLILINFKTGEIKKLPKTKEFSPRTSPLLRTTPEKSKAMFLQRHSQIPEIRLIEFDWETLEMKPFKTLGKDVFGEEWDRLSPHFSISPDFKTLAYAVIDIPNGQSYPLTAHDLKILDLDTLVQKTIDNNVNTANCFMPKTGIPAHEWLDEQTLVYQDIFTRPAESFSFSLSQSIKTCTFPSMKIKTKLTQNYPIHLNNSPIHFNPHLQRIRFQNQILDCKDWILKPALSPYRMKLDLEKGDTKFFRNDIELCQIKGECLDILHSRSGNNLAYCMHGFSNKAINLFAFYAPGASPVQIGSFAYGGHIAGWIEAEDFE